MKRILVIASLACLFFMTGCEDLAKPKIRAKNSWYGTSSVYGIKIGDASWTDIGYGETTDYKETSADSHYIEMLNDSGEWIVVSSGKIGPLEEGKKYTLTVTSSGFSLSRKSVAVASGEAEIDNNQIDWELTEDIE